MIITERWMLCRLEWRTHLNWTCENEHLAEEWEQMTKHVQFLRLFCNYGVLAVTTLPLYTKHVIYSGESTTLRPVKANTERYQNAFSKFYTSFCIYEHATAKLYLLSKPFSYQHRNNNNNNNNLLLWLMDSFYVWVIIIETYLKQTLFVLISWQPFMLLVLLRTVFWSGTISGLVPGDKCYVPWSHGKSLSVLALILCS